MRITTLVIPIGIFCFMLASCSSTKSDSQKSDKEIQAQEESPQNYHKEILEQAQEEELAE